MFQAVNNFLKKKPFANAQFTKIIVSSLIDLVVCITPVKDCFLGNCTQCNNSSLSSILARQLDTSDEDDKCSWFVWKSIDKMVDLHQMRGTITSLFYQIDENWSAFLLHSYFNCEERSFINDLRIKLSNLSHGVLQIDFAENYAFLWQRKLQAAHREQPTSYAFHHSF